jgi:Poly(ADP-ribose) polymerase catalytic domain
MKHKEKSGFAKQVIGVWQRKSVPEGRVVEKVGKGWRLASGKRATGMVMKMLGRRSKSGDGEQQHAPQDPGPVEPRRQGEGSLPLASHEPSPDISTLRGGPDFSTATSLTELSPSDGPHGPSNITPLPGEAQLGSPRRLVFERAPERGRDVGRSSLPLDPSPVQNVLKGPPISREHEKSTAELALPNTSRDTPIKELLENWPEWSSVLGIPETSPPLETYAERCRVSTRCRSEAEAPTHRNRAREALHPRKVWVAALTAALLLFLAIWTFRYWGYWGSSLGKEDAAMRHFKLTKELASVQSHYRDGAHSTDNRVALVLLSDVDNLLQELSRPRLASERLQLGASAFLTDQCPWPDAVGRVNQIVEARLHGTAGDTNERYNARSKATYDSPDQDAKSSVHRTPYTAFPPWAFFLLCIIAAQLAVLQFFFVQNKRETTFLRQRIVQALHTIIPSRHANQQCVRSRHTREGWDSMTDTDYKLVVISPVESEYWDVLGRLQRDMPDAHISRLWRVHNVALWEFYSFHKQRFARDGIAENEVQVWHGTTFVDPAMIYRDQEGFMMQFAKLGWWGRGLYFADRSDHSDSFSYRPRHEAYTDRPGGDPDEREMFLATLLVGNAVYMEGDRSLVVPPLDPAKPGRRYNTVRGKTGDYPVWSVYENGRAYPSYLVRYYKGERNTQRTPYST